jgi:hypothetical protein
MTGPAWLIEPLQGKTALSRVVWIYGLLGSVLYGAIELLLNPADDIAMRIYLVGGVLFSLYVAVAVYRCAFNGVSRFWGRMAQISAILSVLLLPLLAYLDWTGALSLALLGEQ